MVFTFFYDLSMNDLFFKVYIDFYFKALDFRSRNCYVMHAFKSSFFFLYIIGGYA